MLSFGLLLLGFFAGSLSGFFGIGGGIIIIPLLISFFSFSQKLAQGTTLAAMIPPIGLLAAIAYWKAGNVNIKAAILIALGFLLGGLIGGIIVQHVPDFYLRKLFALFLIVIGIKLLFY